MEMKTLHVSIIAFFLIILCNLYAQEKQEFRGETVDKDGVQVINNPNEPLLGEFVFELEEKLSIGNEEDENYVFFRIRNITADAEGNIYVSDLGNYRIQVFNNQGLYLNSVGKRGEGPGEFQWTINLRIDTKSKDLYVIDGLRSLERFNSFGRHLETVKLEKAVYDFHPDGSGNFLAIVSTTTESELSKTLCKINSNGEILENYVKFPWNIFFQKRGEAVTSAIPNHTHTLMMAKITGNRFLYAYSGKYEMNVIDNMGKVLSRIKKDEKPKGFSASEKKNYRNMPVPPHKPFFYRIFTDSAGRIYVQTNITRGQPPDYAVQVDIFSNDGHYLYKSILPRVVYAIEDSLLYRYYWNDESGEELVKCYKIKNWDKMKTGIN